MFMFPEWLAPALIYLVTAGVKSLFGSISGYGSMLVAAAVGAVLLFGEAAIGGLGPDVAEIVNAVLGLLFVVLGGFGFHDIVKYRGNGKP